MRFLCFLMLFFCLNIFQMHSMIEKNTPFNSPSVHFNASSKIKNIKYAPTRFFDLLHTDLKLKPIWELNRLEGEASLFLTPYFYSQKTLVLDAVSFEIHKMNITLKGTKIPFSYSYNSSTININFEKELTHKDTIIVNINYTAIPDSAKPENGRAIQENKGLYFINSAGKRKDIPMQLWTQGETSSNSHWFPTIDHPSEKHTQSLQVTYDKKFVSLSNGKLTSSKQNIDGTKTDLWVQKLPHSIYLTVLVIGEFKIVKDKWKNIAVEYYMEPQYESMARPIFGRTPEMLDFFSKKLNYPFPWDKYSQVIVHDFVAGAMENTSAATFNTFVQKDLRELVDNNDDETVAHELFHHWFGDLATCESWAHLTLNESFANYSEYLWHEYKNGLDQAQEFWNRDFQGYFSNSNRKKEPLIRYDYNHPDDMFDVISYQKGGKILHMLRVYLGDEAFFKTLSIYLKRFSFKTAEYSDLRKIAEEVSGQDLTWFFNQWYMKGGHPVLNFSTKKSDTGATIIISQKHNFDSTFLYRLPLSIDLYTSEGITTHKIILDKKSDTFYFPSTLPVLAVSNESTHSLVGDKKETKPMEEWIYLLKNSKDYLTQNIALKKLKSLRFNTLAKEAIYHSLFSEKPLLVYTALDLIDSEWLLTDKKFTSKISDIFNTNSKGIVKAKALEVLNEDSVRKDFVLLAKKALKDSSYLVESEAIKFLKKTDSLYILNHVLNLPLSNNFNVLNATFDIIAETRDSVYNYRFIDAFSSVKGYQRIALFTHYGTYVSSLSDSSFEKAILLFENEYNSNAETAKYSGAIGFNTLIGALGKMNDETSKNRLLKATALYKKLSEKDKNELDNE